MGVEVTNPLKLLEDGPAGGPPVGPAVISGAPGWVTVDMVKVDRFKALGEKDCLNQLATVFYKRSLDLAEQREKFDLSFFGSKISSDGLCTLFPLVTFEKWCCSQR